MAGLSLKKIIENVRASLSEEGIDIGSVSDDSINEIYREGISLFSKEFGSFGVKVLDEYRSTVLPVRSVKAIENAVNSDSSGGAFSEKEIKSIDFREHILESYENTFLRAMGMPTERMFVGKNYVNFKGEDVLDTPGKSSIVEVFKKRDQSAIDRAKKFKSMEVLLLNKNSEDLNIFSDEEKDAIFSVVSDIGNKKSELEEKGETANEKSLREDFFSSLSKKDEFKNKLAKSESESNSRTSFGQKYDPVLNSVFDRNIMKKVVNKNLLTYHNFLLEESELLFPPLQDSSIEYCLSESDKIISKPFDMAGTSVNGYRTKSSLLESIIRIRLDAVTGKKFEKSKEGFFSDQGEDSITGSVENVDSFSVIEKIIIDRITTSIENFSDSYYELVQNYFKVCSKAKKTISSEESIENKRKTEKYSSEKDSYFSNISDKERELLLKVKTIDDSILILLNRGKFMESDFKSFRTDNISNGISMDILVKAITIPSSYASEKLSQLRDSQDEAGASEDGVADSANKISQIIGLGRGVGIVDVLCFSLAFFSVSTSDLLGLLEPPQYSNFLIEKSDVKIERSDPEIALSRFSKKLIESYQIFISNINGDVI